MCKVSCLLWITAAVVLAVPWTVATILCWTYTEAFELDPKNDDQPKTGWIIAILQSVSAVAYLVYIPCAVLFIGLVGRRSHFSFCCLVAGIPVFGAVPMVTGSVILFISLSAADEDGGARVVGLVTGVSCILSTVTCLFLLCWAMFCGSRGRGKEHRYPIPLAYMPFLRDFRDVGREREVSENERYTEDYPPPRYTFGERKTLSAADWAKTPK